jgi:type IV pilus assembly protein PilA
MNKKAQGFTIVELLIVIVVIAILAAISIAAYTNIQQRAKNTAIINAASQSLKMIQAYIAANGTYPLKGNACITVDSRCATGSGVIDANNTFNANMTTIGILPKSVPANGDGGVRSGLAYLYNSTYKFNDDSRPVVLVYFLFGKNQQCGISGVMSTGSPNYITSTTGYTFYQNIDDTTECRISIPGPAHS